MIWTLEAVLLLCKEHSVKLCQERALEAPFWFWQLRFALFLASAAQLCSGVWASGYILPQGPHGDLKVLAQTE